MRTLFKCGKHLKNTHKRLMYFGKEIVPHKYITLDIL